MTACGFGGMCVSQEGTMKFTTPKFLVSLGITLIVGILAVAGLRALGVIGTAVDPDDPAVLVKQATQALEAVRQRQPGERRPASYDMVLAPLDKLVQQTRSLLESDEYDPVTSYEKLRSLALPIIDLATQADAQARSETGFLAKEYRFNAQKGEACQYLANAMWERINRRLPPPTGYFNEGVQYPPHEMEELRRVMDMGIAASPQNADLFYIRGVVNRAEGLFGPAARDLERAVEIDGEYVGAWNVLGLVCIALKEFDKAEDALERARALSLSIAERMKTPPNEEYTAILYNLATFHEGLASFYARENRIAPTVESQRLLQRHAGEARRYFEEFLQREPSGSADAKAVQSKLQALPR